MRLIAMTAVHNEMRYLPRWYENVVDHVDGIVVLDDRSSDGSGEFLAAKPGVLEVNTIQSSEDAGWDEPYNHRLLTEIAVRHGADWVIGVDPDERLERDFRRRADIWIRWARRRRVRALSVKVRELWGSPTTYRTDGWWGRKRKDVLFATSGPMVFDERPLHGSWAPYSPRRRFVRKVRAHPLADVLVYHCKMIHAPDRHERWLRYKRLDPDDRWNPRGYDYLLDETTLELKDLPPGREYVPCEPN